MHVIIENGLKFLKQTNFKLLIPEYATISIQDDKKIVNFCTEDKINQNNIEKIQLFKIITIFALFDFFIDLKSPNTLGKSFKAKYQNLPSSNDAEIILKQTFRLAKIIRNSFIHNLSNLQQLEDPLTIDYTFNNTNFKLTISDHGLTLFNSIIYLFLSEINGEKEYFSGLIRSMYNDMKSEISQFQDEFGSTLSNTTNGIKLGYGARDTLLNPIYTNNENNIICKNIVNVKNLGNLDLFIKIDGEDFLIPSEALDENKSITLSEIREKWGYTFNHPFFSKVIFS